MTTTAPRRPANRLINATSPYLLQHAHNPVDWYEWSAEALERARREDKPIFLSIGYSACHWCHVMERESFENEDIAGVMNRHFVCIKVDREERPDLDDIYMLATQALTQSGGWPMSVWLTPDQKPFYAGTYFPPDDRYGRPGFKRLLEFLAETWSKDREKIVGQAHQLTQAVEAFSRLDPGGSMPGADRLDKTASMLARSFDPIEGGISGGGANKFPPSMAMDLLLRAAHQARGEGGDATAAERYLALVEITLQKMAYGGIYDQLGGGIARYSTDPQWLVPHFEKMLYDQALVSDIYLKAFQFTSKPLYRRIAGEILDYVIADLQGPEGGYYSTRDADSEGHEGKFYVWSRAEIVQALGPADAAFFCDYYDVSDAGNWEGTNILHVPRPIETVAELNKVEVESLENSLADSRQKLFEIRERRVKPHLDDKVLTAWNGLMIASMARGYRILGEPRYRDSAVRAAQFVLAKLTRDRRLLRTCRQGRSHTLGYLDDHAFFIEGLLNLYETTFEERWLREALRFNELVMTHFQDKEAGGFFFTADDAEKVLVRSKDASDGATPSGNSVQAMNLLRLAVLLDRQDLAKAAERLLTAFGTQIQQSPFRSERMIAALDFHHRRPRELAIVAPASDAAGLESMADAAWRTYVPNFVATGRLVGGSAGEAMKIPLLEEKKPLADKATAYVCRNYACRAPTNDVASMIGELSR